MQLRGAVLSFNAPPDPATQAGVDYLPDGVVVMRDGKIADVLAATEYEAAGGQLSECEDLRGGLILPGLIDCHIHYPQLDMIASYGEQLLDWLNRYAFPAELRYADADYAQLRADNFLNRLSAAGTTTALVFTTVHPHSTDALFSQADQRGMRLIAGKVLMDRNAPDGLRDATPEVATTRAQIERWHGQGRLSYAITPRFAITCSDEQLTAAGALLKDYPGVYLHTHLSEHPDEIAATLDLFPGATSYVDVYDRFGMVGERSIFAHGIHLSDDELRRLAEAGSSIAHCPTSNLFLGSGCLDLERLERFGVRLCVATDVGAGTSLSMVRTLGEGYKVAQLNGQSWHPYAAFYAATAGNAEALHLADRIGRIAPGWEADVTVLSPPPGSVLAERLSSADTLTERLFAYMMLAGSEAVEQTYINGRLAYTRAKAT